MTEYPLYLESGPKQRKTMVHVLDLVGCIANGPTTQDALDATPAAIETYRRFLARHGEPIDTAAPFTTRVAEHIMQGMRLGEGSSDISFAPDLLPITRDEVEFLLARHRALCHTLAEWADAQPPAYLAATPETGRAPGAILLHALISGQYLSNVMGGAPGFSALHGAAERGQLPLPEAYRETADKFTTFVRGATDHQLTTIIEKPNNLRTMRKGLRHAIEHLWEHLAELSRRPGGPQL